MEAYTIFKSLCIIVIAAKICGILARKLKAPQVVGEILAGVLIGPSVLGLVEQSDFLAQLAEIGVVLLMFSAGLQTNLHDLLQLSVQHAILRKKCDTSTCRGLQKRGKSEKFELTLFSHSSKHYISRMADLLDWP